MFSVELVNQLVLEGMAFRDAYMEVGKKIESGIFEIPETLHHTHEGSLGNLCNDQIKARFDQSMKSFRQQEKYIQEKYNSLLGI